MNGSRRRLADVEWRIDEGFETDLAEIRSVSGRLGREHNANANEMARVGFARGRAQTILSACQAQSARPRLGAAGAQLIDGKTRTDDVRLMVNSRMLYRRATGKRAGETTSIHRQFQASEP